MVAHPVGERLGRDDVAGLRLSCGESCVDDFTDALGRQALVAEIDHVLLHDVERLSIGRVGIAGDVDGVSLVPDRRGDRAGGDDDHVDAVNHQFAAQRFRQAFECELRGVVGADKGRADLAADRAHHADAAALLRFRIRRRAEQRGEVLGDDQLADNIDFQLLPEAVDFDVEEGTGIGDAGIVDEAKQGRSVELGGNVRCASLHRGLVSDIEQERGHGWAERL